MTTEFKKSLELTKLIEQKSSFLFGPRFTGKTTLIRQQIAQDALYINLLNAQYSLYRTWSPDKTSLANAKLARTTTHKKRESEKLQLPASIGSLTP